MGAAAIDGDAAITAEDTIAAAEATGPRWRLGWDKEPGEDRAIQMRLKLQRVDGRYARTMPSQYGVFDEVTGKRVGAVTIDRHIGKRRVFRTVVLFDERYSGSFDTHTECVAFVKGVEQY